MTRVIYAPINFGDVVQDGVYDAFRQAGCDLNVFDYVHKHLSTGQNDHRVREEFLDNIKRFQPDVAFLQIQHMGIIDGETIRRAKDLCRKCIMVNWTGDVRNYVPVTYRQAAQYCDYNMISSTGQIKTFEEIIGKKISYLQIGYNPKLYYPRAEQPKEFKYDCTFIGHYNPRENYPGTTVREKACEIMHREFRERFGLFGSAWPPQFCSKGSVDQRSLINIYHDSVCNVSISHYNDLNHYFSDRLLMCMASGRPTISLTFPGWESYFTNNTDLVMVSSVEEIPNKIRWLKNNPDMANFIGTQGAVKVKHEHTYFTMVKKLLNIIGII